MSFVTDLVLHKAKDHLIATMQTPFDQTDLTRANEIKIGRFQQDPTKPCVWLSISYGDDQDPNLLDCNTSVVSKHKDNTGLNIPGYAIGGGSIWWRSFQVRFGCYFLNKNINEETAQTLASEVLGRLLESLSTLNVAGIVDSYGERAIYAVTYGNTMSESGGPTSSYIWRGVVKVDFLTERPF